MRASNGQYLSTTAEQRYKERGTKAQATIVNLHQKKVMTVKEGLKKRSDATRRILLEGDVRVVP
jgi:hypothetical protein